MPFNQEAADRACNFFEHVLKHTMDEWYGKPFILTPWEEEALSQIFGNLDDDGNRIIEQVYLELVKKTGKALALDTPIPTPAGWSTMGEMQIGDALFDENGAVCRVIATSDVMVDHECYAVKFSDGESIIADAEHRWQTKTRKPANTESIWTTRQIAETLRIEAPGSEGANHSIPVAGALLTPDVDLPLHPYALGVWLGDGNSHAAMLTCSVKDQEILEHVAACGVAVSSKREKRNPNVLEVSMGSRYGRGRPSSRCYRGHEKRVGRRCLECERMTDHARRHGLPIPDQTSFSFGETLGRMGLIKNKHIPPQYLRASWNQRLDLLQGLMDTDGYVTAKGDCEFTTVSPRLRDGVLELIRTLGLKPQYSTGRAMLNGHDHGPKYRIRFTAYSDFPVFRLERKRRRQRIRRRESNRSMTRQIIAVDAVDSVPVRCIAVDSPSHLYLAGRSMIPTHNTEFVAGIVLMVLVLTTMPGCQVYGAASATRQALNVYRAACKMVEQEKMLSKHLRILRGTNRILKRSDPDSFYAAVAADGDFGDGVNPAFVVADEVHRWKTRKQLENWDVLSKGGITRRQTLTIAITTAGVQEESPLAWRLHEKTRKIQAGIVSDPRFFGRIYGAEKTDNPGDPATWIKANPSLLENGGFLDKDKIRKEYDSAVAEGDLTSFKRYFLNIWDQKEDRAIDMVQWDASAGTWEAKGLGEATPEYLVAIPPDGSMRVVRPLHHDVLDHFIGRRCWAGVDMSLSTDLTAVALVFPREATDTYDVLPFFWLPDAKIRRMELKLGVPLARWAREGFLELSPGDYIDYRDVQARLVWAAQMFDMQEMCFDPAYARQASGPLNDAGYKTMEIRQSFTNLNEPTKKILELVVRGALHHGNHPIMRWNAGSACTTTNAMDLMMFAKPLREKSTARIDGMSGTATAMSRVIASVNRLAYDSPASVAI